MKTCGLCHTQAQDDEPTCSACGEATFLPQVQPEATEASKPSVAEEAPVPSKRGKR